MFLDSYVFLAIRKNFKIVSVEVTHERILHSPSGAWKQMDFAFADSFPLAIWP
jgi:hypothetical protein